jgi:membrane fusion protein, heavy metal efflux system
MTQNIDARRHRSVLRDALLVGSGVFVTLAAALVWTMWSRVGGTESPGEESAGQTRTPGQEAVANEVRVSADLLSRAGIQTTPVRAESLAERLQVTGTVEANQEQLQPITPLVGGRVERVNVALGDRVQRGAPLMTLSSPQIAELRGNLHAAEAKLGEADATLHRAEQLVDLGAVAGKDLVTAQAEQRTAQAQVAQFGRSLEALGATLSGETGEPGGTSTIVIRAPIAGTVIGREVNSGAWIEASKPVLTVADLGTVWVIVHVPEARLGLAQVGTPVDIQASSIEKPVTGRVGYVDPQLDQETRTARVRVEVPNPQNALKLGMFVTVALERSARAGLTGLSVPDEAVQQVGDRTVVFVATPDSGRFEVRDVDVGDAIRGARVVRAGLTAGERVVTAGAFTLKAQLLKGQFGEEEDLVPRKEAR